MDQDTTVLSKLCFLCLKSGNSVRKGRNFGILQAYLSTKAVRSAFKKQEKHSRNVCRRCDEIFRLMHKVLKLLVEVRSSKVFDLIAVPNGMKDLQELREKIERKRDLFLRFEESPRNKTSYDNKKQNTVTTTFETIELVSDEEKPKPIFKRKVGPKSKTRDINEKTNSDAEQTEKRSEEIELKKTEPHDQTLKENSGVISTKLQQEILDSEDDRATVTLSDTEIAMIKDEDIDLVSKHKTSDHSSISPLGSDVKLLLGERSTRCNAEGVLNNPTRGQESQSLVTIKKSEIKKENVSNVAFEKDKDMNIEISTSVENVTLADFKATNEKSKPGEKVLHSTTCKSVDNSIFEATLSEQRPTLLKRPVSPTVEFINLYNDVKDMMDEVVAHIKKSDYKFTQDVKVLVRDDVVKIKELLASILTRREYSRLMEKSLLLALNTLRSYRLYFESVLNMPANLSASPSHEKTLQTVPCKKICLDYGLNMQQPVSNATQQQINQLVALSQDSSFPMEFPDLSLHLTQMQQNKNNQQVARSSSQNVLLRSPDQQKHNLIRNKIPLQNCTPYVAKVFQSRKKSKSNLKPRVSPNKSNLSLNSSTSRVPQRKSFHSPKVQNQQNLPRRQSQTSMPFHINQQNNPPILKNISMNVQDNTVIPPPPYHTGCLQNSSVHRKLSPNPQTGLLLQQNNFIPQNGTANSVIIQPHPQNNGLNSQNTLYSTQSNAVVNSHASHQPQSNQMFPQNNQIIFQNFPLNSLNIQMLPSNIQTNPQTNYQNSQNNVTYPQSYHSNPQNDPTRVINLPWQEQKSPPQQPNPILSPQNQAFYSLNQHFFSQNQQLSKAFSTHATQLQNYPQSNF